MKNNVLRNGETTKMDIYHTPHIHIYLSLCIEFVMHAIAEEFHIQCKLAFRKKHTNELRLYFGIGFDIIHPSQHPIVVIFWILARHRICVSFPYRIVSFFRSSSSSVCDILRAAANSVSFRP